MADNPDHSESELDTDLDTSGTEPESVEVSQNTGQIPLLDDVVFNTSLPFPKPKPQPRKAADDTGHRPIATDLFGGSPDTAVSGPLSPDYQATDMDAVASRLRNSTEQVVDNLVAEFSQEIVSRLRNELTVLLDELNDTASKPDSE